MIHLSQIALFGSDMHEPHTEQFESDCAGLGNVSVANEQKN